MTNLKPCGTQAAFLRHLRRGEEPCEACVMANREARRAQHAAKEKPRRPAVQSRPTNVHTTEMDRLLEKAPPVIAWRKNSRGVMVATSVYDPHGDAGWRPRQTVQPQRTAAPIQVEYVECTDENLLAAARTEL